MNFIRTTFFLATILLLVACKNNNPYFFIKGFTQGTTYHIKYQHTENYKIEIDSLLHVFDNSLSNYDTSSAISLFNKKTFLHIEDSLFIRFLEISEDVYKRTDGAFDITVAPVVNAWKFGFNNAKSIPDNSMIDSLKQYIGFSKLLISHNDISKPEKVEVISNAVAQGMSVDFIAEFLEQKGIQNFMVEIGGEVKAKGVNEHNALWRIGVDLPQDDTTKRELKAVIQLNNSSIATSGNYRKYYIKNGKKYSHTIDPHTGFPVQHSLLSATIIAEDCGYADAFATACMVLGFEKSKELIENDSSLHAYFIYDNNGTIETWQSEKVKDAIIEDL